MTLDQAASESMIRLTALAREIGVNHSTVWRWRIRGWRGYKLDSIRFGEAIYTTREAFHRFTIATNWEYAPHRPRNPK